jgi:hypothetical protein
MQGRRNFSAIRRKHFSSQTAAVLASASASTKDNADVNNHHHHHHHHHNNVHSNDDDNYNNNNNNNNNKLIQSVKKISDRLETGLNEYALLAIMDLLQRGEHPDAIVAAVTSLSQRATTTTASTTFNTSG